MNEPRNEIYALIDEEFLSRFSENHLDFMKQYYYACYKVFCDRIKRKPISFEDFFTNMHRRRFQLYQLCCPYCGAVSISIRDKQGNKEVGCNYCHNCGRSSTLDNVKKQIARFIRINRMNRISLRCFNFNCR